MSSANTSGKQLSKRLKGQAFTEQLEHEAIALLKMARTGIRTHASRQVAILHELVRNGYVSRDEPEPGLVGKLMRPALFALTESGESLLAEYERAGRDTGASQEVVAHGSLPRPTGLKPKDSWLSACPLVENIYHGLLAGASATEVQSPIERLSEDDRNLLFCILGGIRNELNANSLECAHEVDEILRINGVNVTENEGIGRPYQLAFA